MMMRTSLSQHPGIGALLVVAARRGNLMNVEDLASMDRIPAVRMGNSRHHRASEQDREH